MNDPYEVLQVHRRAEPEVIRAAYRALARKYHPDSGGELARMIAITEAWAILSNSERRATFDAEAAKSRNRRAGDRKAASSAAQAGTADRTGPSRAGSGSVVDFGRYAGWSIGSLVDHDPDYLQWLARTPIGRRLSAEIDEAMTRRAAEEAARRPSPERTKRRRSLIRPWASADSGPQ